MRALGRFIVRFFAVIGVLVVLAVGASIAVFFWAEPRAPRIAGNPILTLDLTQALPDAPGDRGLSRLLLPSAMSLHDALSALEKAGNDPRVKALIARVGDGGMGVAETQELRDAVAAFR